MPSYLWHALEIFNVYTPNNLRDAADTQYIPVAKPGLACTTH